MISNLKRKQKSKKMVFFAMSILSLALMIICTSPSFAADLTLSLSSPTGGQNKTIPVNLGLSYLDGASASGFQLDINYDTDVLENPSAVEGNVLNNAGKEIDSIQPSSGVFRIVVSGINQNIIQPNEEAAYIYFYIKSDAPLGETDLTLSNLAATDEDGQPLDPLGSDGSIVVVESIPTLSEWGMIIFITIMMGIGIIILRKRRMA